MPSSALMPFLSSIITGLTGAFVGWLVAQSTRAVKEKLIQRRFPVEGLYISYFEDIENNQSIVFPSESNIKQKGYKIEGKTKLQDGRSWSLEGSILEGRHVAGIYWADLRHDQGVGSFYLTFDGEDLAGIWTGFDNMNNMINYGEYKFLRCRNVEIRAAKKKDAVSILFLAAQVFGSGYLESINPYFDDPEAVVMGAFSKKKGEAGSRLVGFAIGYMIADGSEEDLAGLNLSGELAYATNQKRLALLKTVSVAAEDQGRGVANALIEKMEAELSQMGAEAIVVPAWEDLSGINIEGLMKNNKYSWHQVIKQYWKKRCDQGEFACPSRSNECSCNAVFYKKTLT